MNRVSPKVLALLGTLTLVWGTNWPLFKIALDELPVLTFRAIVLVTASLVLLAISGFLSNYWWLIIGVVLAAVFAVRVSIRTPTGRLRFEPASWRTKPSARSIESSAWS